MTKSQRPINIEALLLMAKYNEDVKQILMDLKGKAGAIYGLDPSPGEIKLLDHQSLDTLGMTAFMFNIPGVTADSVPDWKDGPAVLTMLDSLGDVTGFQGFEKEAPKLVTRGIKPDRPGQNKATHDFPPDGFREPPREMMVTGIPPDSFRHPVRSLLRKFIGLITFSWLRK